MGNPQEWLMELGARSVITGTWTKALAIGERIPFLGNAFPVMWESWTEYEPYYGYFAPRPLRIASRWTICGDRWPIGWEFTRQDIEKILEQLSSGLTVSSSLSRP